ncbi:MAG: creatininase family protein [Anaerolineae bacterium]
MRIQDMHWAQVEAYLRQDDRCVLPIGCTEQHAFLSLSTDSILAERVSVEAAEPLGVLVFPIIHYGITPSFRAFPGTVSLRVETLIHLVRDVLTSLREQGFRRILVVNGHGGNIPVQTFCQEWIAEHPEVKVQWHNWWNAPQTWAKVQEIDPLASHASWMENFPWTRLANVSLPNQQKPMVDVAAMRRSNPKQVRELLGDGNFGGLYQRRDEEMQALWAVAIAETRTALEVW